MSKQQALLETLLGAAELNGNRLAAHNIRDAISKTIRSHGNEGYERLARAAFEPKRLHRKAA